jgi:putative transposase
MAMTARRTTDEVSSLVPATRGVPDAAAMREWAEELVARARAEGVKLTGDDGFLTGLVRQVLQTGLEVELADHLGYEPYDASGRGAGNIRNGTSRQTVTTEIGEVELAVPRDRNGTFDPVTVPKHQRRLDGLTLKSASAYFAAELNGQRK